MSQWDDPTRGYQGGDDGWGDDRRRKSTGAPGHDTNDTTRPTEQWRRPDLPGSSVPGVPADPGPDGPEQHWSGVPRSGSSPAWPGPAAETPPAVGGAEGGQGDDRRGGDSYPYDTERQWADRPGFPGHAASPNPRPVPGVTPAVGGGSQPLPRHGAGPDGFHRVGPGGVPELWPGPIPLRPLTFGEIFESAFGVLRFNPKTLFGLSFVLILGTMVVSALVAVPYILLNLDSFTGDSTSTPGTGLLDGMNVITSLITFVLSGILIVPIGEAALGRRIGAKESWGRLKGRIGALTGYFLLLVLVNALIFIPFVLAVAGAAASGSGLALGLVVVLGGLVALCAGIYVNVTLSLAPVAIVLEQLGPIQGIRRSFRLIRGGWWRAFLILLVTILLTWLVSAILMLPVMAILMVVVLGSVLPGMESGVAPNPASMAIPLILGMIAMALVSVFINTLIRPYSSAVNALIYLDRRFRTEALAVDLLAEAERSAPR